MQFFHRQSAVKILPCIVMNCAGVMKDIAFMCDILLSICAAVWHNKKCSV